MWDFDLFDQDFSWFVVVAFVRMGVACLASFNLWVSFSKCCSIFSRRCNIAIIDIDLKSDFIHSIWFWASGLRWGPPG